MELVYAAEKDLDAVYDLVCRLENKTIARAPFDAAFLRNITDESIVYLLAVEEGAVLGFASLHIQFLLHHAGAVGEIQEIIVDEACRGRGLGKILFQRLKEIAEEKDCVLLEVCCNQARTASHPFYISQGTKNTHYKFTLPIVGAGCAVEA